MFASSSLEEVYHYVYYQLTSVALTMLDDVNGLSINFFSNEFIQAIVNFFTLFAWGLGLTGAAIAIMDFAVSYQTGGGGSFTGTDLDKVTYGVFLYCCFKQAWIFTARCAAWSSDQWTAQPSA